METNHPRPNQPRNNQVEPKSLVEQNYISRQTLRHQLRQIAAVSFAERHGRIVARGSRSGNIHYNIPRRARRKIARNAAKQYYRALMAEIGNRQAVPKNWVQQAKAMLPVRMQQGFLKPEYKLVEQAEAAGA